MVFKIAHQVVRSACSFALSKDHQAICILLKKGSSRILLHRDVSFRGRRRADPSRAAIPWRRPRNLLSVTSWPVAASGTSPVRHGRDRTLSAATASGLA
jgi:hypothetical protein